MAKGYSLQSLGNGAYRVSGVRVDPTTGKYVTRSSAGRTQAKSVPTANDKQPKQQ